MIYILNKKEQIIDVLEPNKKRKYYNDMHVQDLKENSETYDFMTDVDIAPNSTIVLKAPSGELHPFIVQQIQQISNEYRTKKYYCDAEYLELRYTRILEPILLSGQTAKTALQYGIQGTRWVMGIIESDTVKDIDISEHMTLLKYIRMIASEFNLEMRFRVEFSSNTISRRYIDLVQRAGLDMGKEIVFGKDLQNIERIEQTSGIVTALYAVGQADDNGNAMTIASVNGGKTYVEDLNALERWGKDGEHRYDIYTPSVNTKDLTPQMLFDLTSKELAKRINSIVTYKIDALDLYDVLGMEHERVFLGDTVRVKDEGFEPALYVEARIIKIERSYTDPSQNKFTLGDYREIDINTYQYIREIQALLNSSKETWNKAEDNAVSRAQLIITQTAESWNATVTSLSEDIDGQISSLQSSLTVMDGQISSKVSQSDFTGNTIASLINQTATTIDINASKINLTGAVSVLSDITGNLGTITAGLIKGTTFITSDTGNSVTISGDTLTSYQNKGSSMAGLRVLTLDSGKLSVGAQQSLQHVDVTNNQLGFYAGGTIYTDATLYFNGDINFSSANVSGISVSYADSAGSVDTGYANSYGSSIYTVVAKSSSSQGITFQFLSNGTLVATHQDGRYSTFVPSYTTF